MPNVYWSLENFPKIHIKVHISNIYNREFAQLISLWNINRKPNLARWWAKYWANFSLGRVHFTNSQQQKYFLLK